MRIAIPIVNDRLCMHFGHCEQFALVEVDDGDRSITSTWPAPRKPGQVE